MLLTYANMFPTTHIIIIVNYRVMSRFFFFESSCWSKSRGTGKIVQTTVENIGEMRLRNGFRISSMSVAVYVEKRKKTRTEITRKKCLRQEFNATPFIITQSEKNGLFVLFTFVVHTQKKERNKNNRWTKRKIEREREHARSKANL